MNNKNREYMNIAELGRKIKYESHNFYELELDKPLLDKKEFSHSWLTNMQRKIKENVLKIWLKDRLLKKRLNDPPSLHKHLLK